MSEEKPTAVHVPAVIVAAQLIKEGLIAVGDGAKSISFSITSAFRPRDYITSIPDQMGRIADRIDHIAEGLGKVAKALDHVDQTFYAEGYLKVALKDLHRIAEIIDPSKPPPPAAAPTDPTAAGPSA